MEIVFHIGAHHTDGGALMRSLMKNADALARRGIAVPGPSRYRKTMGTMTTRLRGEIPSPDAQAALKEALVDGDPPERMFLASENFICVPDKVLESGTLYARTHKTRWLRNLFPEDEVVFALGMRSPATLLSSLWTEARLGGATFQGFIGDTNPLALRWSDVITRIRAENPDCPVVAWCHEDSPFIWPEVMHIVTGVPIEERLEGEDDMLARVMQRAGMILFRERLEEEPDMTPEHRRETAMDLLEDWAAPDQVEIEIDLPGWTADYVDSIEASYEADLDAIREIPGVVLVEP